MLTVVDGRMGGTVETKNIKVFLLTVVDDREGGWMKNLKNVDGC